METTEYIKMGNLEKNHWYFVAKRRFLDAVMEKHATEESAVFLDVGCGTGAVMEQMAAKKFSVFGVDMSETALEYCRQKGLVVEKGFADQMPFADNTFDIVCALDVLEHLDNPELAVKEIKRVLKNNGIFIATVPAHQWLWSYHDESLHHKKRYSRKDLVNLLSQDLDLIKVSWIHGFILLPAILLRLFKNIIKGTKQESDVKESSVFVNRLMSLVYFIEISLFKIFGTLPFGLSLLAVAKKK